MNAWEELDDAEYEAIWSRFDAQFSFRASTSAAAWPGIAEPSPSITYDISSIWGRGAAWSEALDADLRRKGLDAFRRIVPSSGWLYALDWQHSCYRLYPHRPFDAESEYAWAVSILPDGDYHVFAAENLRFGLFGHPWEQTICVFGEQLLGALESNRPQLLSAPIRRDGRRSPMP